MNHVLHCENCNEVIVKSIGEEVKIRGKLLCFKKGLAFVVCKGCDAEIEVPVKLDQELVKSLVSTAKVYHYVKR